MQKIRSTKQKNSKEDREWILSCKSVHAWLSNKQSTCCTNNVPERFEYTNEVNRRSNTKVKQYEGQRIQRSKEKGQKRTPNGR